MSDDRLLTFVKLDPIEGVGTYKVVTSDQLEYTVKQGFKPVACFRDQATAKEEVRIDQPGGRGYYTEWRDVARERTCFLMAQDATSMVAEFEKERQRAKVYLDQAVDKKRAAEKLVEEATKAAEQSGKVIDSMTKQLANQAREIEQMRERSQRLEADIGKIRTAIGERQMTDILGGGK